LQHRCHVATARDAPIYSAFGETWKKGAHASARPDVNTGQNYIGGRVVPEDFGQGRGIPLTRGDLPPGQRLHEEELAGTVARILAREGSVPVKAVISGDVHQESLEMHDTAHAHAH
jgi:hypothetical protein